MSRRSGPSPLLIIFIGAFVVFGGYYIWTGFLRFLEDQGNITADVTREAFASATARSITQRPTIFVPATFTPLPPCQEFRVRVERAVYRDCPSQDNRECPIRDVAEYGAEFCVYDRVQTNPEWYVVDLNPGGAFRDIVYMHESVLESINPTPTPAPTVTPLPATSPAPTVTAPPAAPLSPTGTPNPDYSPAPSPTLTPSATPAQVSI